MENNNQEQTDKGLDLMSFDLGEVGGGEQMIFAHKQISEKEYYVFTLGNGPKLQETDPAKQAAEQATAGVKDPVAKKLLKSIRHHIPGMNKNATAENETANAASQNMKLRCFKLSRLEGKKFTVEEYVTPQGVSDVARAFGAGQNEPEMGK